MQTNSINPFTAQDQQDNIEFNKTNEFISLPEELILEIVGFLSLNNAEDVGDFRDFRTLCRVSHRFSKIGNENYFHVYSKHSPLYNLFRSCGDTFTPNEWNTIQFHKKKFENTYGPEATKVLSLPTSGEIADDEKDQKSTPECRIIRDRNTFFQTIAYELDLSTEGIDFNQKSVVSKWCKDNKGQLEKLKPLNIKKIAFLPSETKKLPNLEIIVIKSKNEIQLPFFPVVICSMTSLKTINLTNAGLNYLPNAIGKLSNLNSLDISGNKIKEIPATIENLTRLTTLICSNNKLTTLPEEIGKLTKLTTLECSNNEISILPETLALNINLTSFSCKKK